MTELTYLIRKRSDLSDEQFRSACDRYEAFLNASAQALGIKNAQIQQKVATICGKCFSVQRKLQEPQFDAQVTMTLDSVEDYIAGAGSAPGIAAMDALVAEEKQFVDLAKSQAVFLETTGHSRASTTATAGSQSLSS